MKRKCFFAVLCCGGAAFLAGCAETSTKDDIKPSGTAEVTLEATKKIGKVTVGFANLVTLTMPPAAAGCEWQIAFHDPRFLRQHSGFLPPKEPGGGAAITFVAIKMGTTRLKFVLLPPASGKSADPIDQQELAVVIE